MSSHTTSGPLAAAAGNITIGGDLTVNRMGFGAMRLTGRGIWGPPADRPEADPSPPPRHRARRRFHRHGGLLRSRSVGRRSSRRRSIPTRRPRHRDQGRPRRPGPDRWMPNGQPGVPPPPAGGQPSAAQARAHRPLAAAPHRSRRCPRRAVRRDARVPARRVWSASRPLRGVGQPDRAGPAASVPIVSVQNRYNLTDREWEAEVDVLRARGHRVPALVPAVRRRPGRERPARPRGARGTGRRSTRSRSPGCSPARRPCW